MLKHALPGVGALVACSCLSACGPPSPEVLAQKYSSAPHAYAALKSNATADLGNRHCMIVGGDYVADGVSDDDWHDYRKNADGSWYESGDSKTRLDINQVLASVDIAKARYDEYLGLLRKAGGERLTYCNGPVHGNFAEVLVFQSGLAVSGCSAVMRWAANQKAPKDRSGSQYVRSVKVDDEWELALDCT